MNDKKRKIVYAFLLLFLPTIMGLLISSFPSLRLRYLSWGHDLAWHLNAIRGQSYLLSNRMFPIYINPLANGGAGDCRYIIYPYLFTYIPAIINNIIKDHCISINVFIILINIFTFICTYKSSMIIFNDRVSSVFSSSFYLLCFYRLFNIYTRQAMGEYIALVFTPLVVAGFYNIFFGNKKKWYYLVIGLSFIIQSHIITSFYYILLVIIASILCIPFIIRDIKILPYFLLSGVLTILLNIWYLIPFLQYYLEGQISSVSFGQSIHFISDLYSNFIINFTDREVQFNCLGFESIFAMILTPVLLIIIAIKSKFDINKKKIDRNCIIAFVFLLIFYYYFIVAIGLVRNEVLMKVYAKQQFLYRELGRGLIFLAMAFGYGVSNVVKKEIPKTIIIYLCLIISTYTTFTYLQTKVSNEKFDIPVEFSFSDYLYNHDNESKNGMILPCIEQMDASIFEKENLFKKELNNAYINVTNNNIEIIDLNKGILKYKIEYSYNGDNYKDEYVEIPLVAFTGYKAVDGNGNDIKIYRGKNDYISIFLNDKKGVIDLKYDPPLLWKVGNYVSLITIFAIFIYVIFRKVFIYIHNNSKHRN